MNHSSSRTCSKCQTPKLLTDFPADSRVADGRAAECKECKRQRRKNNRAQINIYNKEWARKNPEKVLANSKRTYQKNRRKRLDWARNYRKRYPDKRRESDFKRQYGITLHDYDAILRLQNGGCAICEQVAAPSKRLVVDHDHVTGKVRGLLCDKHNRALGFFGDDAEMLTRAAMYLTEHQNTLVQIAA